MKNKNPKLYAFCKYDKYPYVNGGVISSWCVNDYPGPDYVELENYGKGFYFKPIKIVPKEIGLKMMKELETLTVELNNKQNELREEYKGKLKKFDFIKI